MRLKVKKLHPDAQLPEYGSDGAGCFDLRCVQGGTVEYFDSVAFDTGLAFEVPPGWVMMIYSRSGHGFKNGLRLANCVGVIDSDYRGEVKVKIKNDTSFSFEFDAGDRIAQAMLVPVKAVAFEEVNELSETARGAGGFGSTGSN